MPNLINHSYLKILETIRIYPGINLRGIITETRLSPNAVTNIVNNLVSSGALNERRLGNKRIYVRQFFINAASSLIYSIFTLIENEKRQAFYQKYHSLKPITEQIIHAFPTVKALLIYGSYAKGVETKESDIDILIIEDFEKPRRTSKLNGYSKLSIGSVQNKERLLEIFITLEAEPSIKIESLINFKKKISDPLHQEMLRHHVVIHDKGILLKETLMVSDKMREK